MNFQVSQYLLVQASTFELELSKETRLNRDQRRLRCCFWGVSSPLAIL